MGVIAGINPGNEPRADGYLRGQIWNRPVPSSGKWIIFQIVYTEVPEAVRWLNGIVITSHPPALYLGQGNPGNIKPFGAIRCDVYTGDPPPEPRPDEFFIGERTLPASGLGVGSLQQVSWSETPPVYQDGISVATIGINTSFIPIQYLYFDFLGEFYKSLSPIDSVGDMIPRVIKMLVYTASIFPDETSPNWNDLLSIPANTTAIARAELPGRGVWILNGLPVTGADCNYFSISGLLFVADINSLQNSRFVRQYFDADSTIIPNKNTANWNGGQSSDARGSLFHWNVDALEWELTF